MAIKPEISERSRAKERRVPRCYESGSNKQDPSVALCRNPPVNPTESPKRELQLKMHSCNCKSKSSACTKNLVRAGNKSLSRITSIGQSERVSRLGSTEITGTRRRGGGSGPGKFRLIISSSDAAAVHYAWGRGCARLRIIRSPKLSESSRALPRDRYSPQFFFFLTFGKFVRPLIDGGGCLFCIALSKNKTRVREEIGRNREKRHVHKAGSKTWRSVSEFRAPARQLWAIGCSRVD